MANVAVGNQYQLIYFCRLGDQTSLNVRYGEVTAFAGTAMPEQEMADGLSAIAGANYVGVLPADAEYYGCSVRFQIFPNPPAALFSSAGRANGALGTHALPAQVSGIITLRTALAGRRGRGRVYVPFPPSVAADVNVPPTPTGAYKTVLDSLAPVFNQTLTISSPVNPTNTVDLQPKIWHKVGNTYTTITSHLSRLKFATQRRRGDYGRPNPPPF